MQSQQFFECSSSCRGNSRRSGMVCHILRELVHVTPANKQGIAVIVRSNEAFLIGWAMG